MALVVGNQVVGTRESPAADLRVTTTFLSLSSSHFSGVFLALPVCTRGLVRKGVGWGPPEVGGGEELGTGMEQKTQKAGMREGPSWPRKTSLPSFVVTEWLGEGKAGY